ncbi:MAG: hypothetical protein KAW92_11700 [Candidatus Cloacimonetes bacterium]|nr:hypothetical protein [Candidatus Cloacimonadota bacterium]
MKYKIIESGGELLDRAIDENWESEVDWEEEMIIEGEWTLPLEILAQVAEDGSIPTGDELGGIAFEKMREVVSWLLDKEYIKKV